HGPPNDAPSTGSIIRYLARDKTLSLPAAVTVGEPMYNDGPTIWPGQHAGALGRRFDPWLLRGDPSAPGFEVPGLWLPEDISPLRINERQRLLTQVQQHLDNLEREPAVADYATKRQQAVALLASSEARLAFDLERESDRVRDRYGRNQFGQSVLLARRLV